MKSILVFCGSSMGTDPIYQETARKTGDLLARKGIRLIYGAGNVGLMGTLADAALDKAFLDEARAAGLLELKGHRSVGGMRASLYNAMPMAGVEALIGFMQAFATRHG